MDFFIAGASGRGIFIWGILLPDFRRVALFLQPFQLRFLQIVYTPVEVWRALTAENLGRFYADFVYNTAGYI